MSDRKSFEKKQLSTGMKTDPLQVGEYQKVAQFDQIHVEMFGPLLVFTLTHRLPREVAVDVDGRIRLHVDDVRHFELFCAEES